MKFLFFVCVSVIYTNITFFLGYKRGTGIFAGQQIFSGDRHKVLSNTETRRHRVFRSCFEFLQKVFLGLMYPFSCVLWAIFWPFSLLFFVRQPAIFLITEAKMPQKLIPNHHTINSKQLLNLQQFKTVFHFIGKFKMNVRNQPTQGRDQPARMHPGGCFRAGKPYPYSLLVKCGHSLEAVLNFSKKFFLA